MGLNNLFVIDLVNAKSGKKLTRLERFINEAASYIAGYGVGLIALSFIVFIGYLMVNAAIFLINV